ncbi:MAG: ROK family protein [Elusimicrobiales bacterium]
MAAKKTYRVGIDIGGTKILAGVVDARDNLLASAKAKTMAEEGERYLINTITGLVARVLEEGHVRREAVSAIGVGCPGLINIAKNSVIFAPNIPFLSDYPLGRRLERELNVPCIVENDVNMGLYGEYRFGAAAGCSHAAGFFLGTGIGGALILDGKLYRGARGAAGEFGHIFVDPLGPLCGCGNRGCLEASAGRLSLSAEAAVMAARGQAKSLLARTGTDVRAIKSGALAKAAASGDRDVRELVKLKAAMIGIAMANVLHITDPEIIVLGGGMMEAMGDIILPEAEKSMREHSLPSLRDKVKVVRAKLGDNAAVMGAAAMAAERI